jgi:hypothetical protein
MMGTPAADIIALEVLNSKNKIIALIIMTNIKMIIIILEMDEYKNDYYYSGDGKNEISIDNNEEYNNDYYYYYSGDGIWLCGQSGCTGFLKVATSRAQRWQ